MQNTLIKIIMILMMEMLRKIRIKMNGKLLEEEEEIQDKNILKILMSHPNRVLN